MGERAAVLHITTSSTLSKNQNAGPLFATNLLKLIVVVEIESNSRVVQSEIGVDEVVYTLRGFDAAAAVDVVVVVIVLELDPPASGNCKAEESKRLGMVIENCEVSPAAAAAESAAAGEWRWRRLSGLGRAVSIFGAVRIVWSAGSADWRRVAYDGISA